MSKVRKVLVTGGAGYIGGHVIRDLAGCFDVVRIYDNMLSRNYENLMNLPGGTQYEFVEGDIFDRLHLSYALRDIEYVVHLAGVSSTPFSFQDTKWSHQTNYWGTSNVVDTAKEAGVRVFVYASSTAVYKPEGISDEQTDVRPVSPYGKTVAKAEQVILSHENKDFSPRIIRLGTVFGSGKGMKFDDVVGRLTYLGGVKKKLIVHGDGNQKRPFIHVKDASRLIIEGMQNPSFPTIVNGVTINTDVNSLVEMIMRFVPSPGVLYTDQDFRTKISFSVQSIVLDQIPFEGKFDLKDGIQELMNNWMNLSGFSIQDEI